MPPRVVLVGPMGSGKTTVGRILAQRWDVGFRDTDADIQARAGKSVQDVFVDDGEPAFRAMEHEAVTVALAEHPGVLALGGGAVLDERTRVTLRAHRVVFLRVGVSDAVKRVGLGSGRPLLMGNVRARVKALLEERAAIYESVAEITVETDGRTPADVADEIERQLSPIPTNPIRSQQL